MNAVLQRSLREMLSIIRWLVSPTLKAPSDSPDLKLRKSSVYALTSPAYRRSFAVLAVLIGWLSSQAAWAQITINGGGTYPTIQAAVDAANTNDVIAVPAGMYTEQLLITKALTINGAGAGSTIVQAPAVMTAGQLATDHRNIIEIRNGVTVIITGIRVNGPLAPTSGCGDLFYGININQGAGLNLSSSSVTNIYLDPMASFFGCQSGFGIRAGFNALSSPGSLTATNVTVSNYQKAGIIIDGAGSNGVIQNAIVSGIGPTPSIAQNGIQISRGATGDVQSSTITGNNYIPPSGTTTAAGLLTFGAGPVTATGNTFTGNDVGISVAPDPAAVTPPGLLTANNNTFSNNDVAGTQVTPPATFSGSGNSFDKSVTNNNKPGTTYATIQSAVNAASAGDILTASAGTFDEQVLVNKGVTIVGQGASTIVNFSGTVAGKPTLFDVSANNVTIQGIHFIVDLSRLSSAILATNASINAITVKDNIVDPTGTPPSGLPPGSPPSALPYGTRNAISINYGDYRVNGSVITVTATGNTVNGVGLTNSFRAGICTDEAGGTFTGNSIQSINQDIQVRFGSNGDVNISNNNLRGGGIELAEHNAGAGTFTVSNNIFDGTFSNGYTSLLRLKNNASAKLTNVSSNTFASHNWGISLENYQNVNVTNNRFDPFASSGSYRHVTFDTKEFSSSSGLPTVPAPVVSLTLTGNTFNGSSVPNSGTAVIFLNQDNDNPTFGPIVLGTAGSANNFAGSLGTFIALDGNTGLVAPNNTQAAPFAVNLNAANNIFDVGTGPKLPAAMNTSERIALENKLTHKPDNAALGLISFFNPVLNVSQGTSYSTIQAAIDAASDGNIIQLAEYTFNERATVTKPLTITGVSQTGTIIDGTGLVPGNGFNLPTGVSGITIGNLTIKNQQGAGDPNNVGNGIYGRTNSNLTISGVIVTNNGKHGIILEALATLTDVSVTNSTLASNGVGAGGRGFIIFNQLKQNITLTNNTVINNGLTGIDINEGTATGVTISGNTVSGNGDAGISLLGALATGNANLISGNTISSNGRYGMEVKSSIGTGATSGPGSLVIEGNNISGATNVSGTRDIAGIAVIRRAAAFSVNNQETPKGAVVRNNNVSGFAHPGAGEGFGIVVEGVNYLVTGNTVSLNDIGIQEQQTPINPSDPNRNRTSGTPADGDSQYDVSDYFDRGNSIYACGVVNGNTLDNNNVASRTVGTVGAPFLSLTASSPLSCTAPTVTLEASAGFASYTFSTGASQVGAVTSNSATVDATGTYSVTATAMSGCVSTTNVTVVGSTTATPVDLTVSSGISCTATSVTLTASAGFDSYTFSTGASQVGGSTGNTATVIAAGTYSVSAVNASGCLSTTTITVVGSTTATPVDLVASGALSCSTTSVTLTASAGFTSYTFSTGASQVGGSTGNTATVIATGTYSVTAANASGCLSTSNVTVVGSTTATPVDLLVSGALSCSTTSVTLTASAGFTSYTFSTGASQVGGSTGNTATVNTSGTYSVTAANASGCLSTSTVTVTGSTTATPVDLTVSGAISCTTTSVTLTASAGFTSYTFSTGATQVGGSAGNTATVITAGTYSVTAVNASGCLSTSTVTVTGSTTATPVDLTSSGPLSCSAPSVTLTASPGFSSYTFSTGASQVGGLGGNTATVNTAGTYSVTAANASGCLSTSNVTVTGSTTATAVNLTASGPLSCSAPSVTLTATPGFTSYVFSTGAAQQGGSGGNTATVNAAGTYSVTAINASGCQSTSNVTVTGSTTASPVNLVASGALSCSTTSVTLTASAGFTSYTFSTGATQVGGSAGNTATVITAGTYSVTAANASGCLSTSNVTVTGSTTATPVDLTSSGPLSCSAPSVTLTASPGFSSYTFSTGASQVGGLGGNTATVNTAGTYSVTAANASGCLSTSNVTVTGSTTATAVNLTASGPLSCSAPSVTLTATPGFTSYVFSTGAAQQGGSGGNTATVNAAGTYSVTAINASGCQSTSNVTVTGSTTASPVNLVASGPLSCSSTTVTLTATPGFTSYVFSTGAAQQGGSGGNTATVNAAGTYSVTAINPSGCQSTTNVTVVGSTTATPVSLTSSGPLSCSSTTVTLTATPGFTSYVFSTGANQQGGGNTATVSTTGVYSVTAINADACTSFASTPVTYQECPPPGSFTIVSVTMLGCSPAGPNLRHFSFTPVYSGLTGQPISFSVVNELPPTTLAGPYSLDKYTDSPVIVLKATQQGTPGEATFSYNWLNACVGMQPTNTAPSVVAPVPPQSATVNQTYSYVISAGTFTDAETPNSLTYSVTGLPPGISFSAPNFISGTPSTTVGSPFSVTVTATDPGGLTASTVFPLTVNPAATTATFGITSVNLLNCTTLTPNRRSISFNPVYSGTTGQQITFSVVNELAPTTNAGPYQLDLYTDNPVIVLKATQQNTPGEASFNYNWLEACNNTPSTNTPPTVANPIGPQSATVNQGYSFVIPGNTFTDAQTPNNLALSVSGLPAGLGFTPPATISGTPSTSAGSPFSVTVTATDPGGLSTFTVFQLTVNPQSTTPPTNFAITGATLVNCSSLTPNRRSISFNPIYSGTNGQQITFSVVNELAPTTNAGPYQLNLYTDNPVIVLKATQQGTPGEASFNYNWLDACNNVPSTNTPPTVANPIGPQSATVNVGYNFNIPANTFNDAETPGSLVLSVSGLPTGLNFNPPANISGTPSTSAGSPYTVTVTATDPGGLSTNTTFQLTVNPNTSNGTFSIASVNTLNCTTLTPNRKSISFQPVYTGTTGQPISFSVVNELAPTTSSGPYSLTLYTDNPSITLKAVQTGTPGEATFNYNWLNACNSMARLGAPEVPLQVVVLGNPVIGESVDVSVKGAEGSALRLRVVNAQGRPVHEQTVEQAGANERVRMNVGHTSGIYLLDVSIPGQHQTIKLLKP
ncbi:right-handed parallel beta-helix repeat-containing protein [Spirosoma sp. BT702]|uniref:Right-handed parallel beta-helix repeat-containing protein n=1 Tax=Spirosoma profusum TaxID=2771354 RepID=A0A927ARV6_9BACT|nr:putative Ig domain-containing protein [Spirosoma profusum]MBD2702913.1 right-handed parallel beta-helix repeat-containing protein [Spirosoma profusum]